MKRPLQILECANGWIVRSDYNINIDSFGKPDETYVFNHAENLASHIEAWASQESEQNHELD